MGAGSIQCEACGKQYAARPELYGKRVRCKCGQIMLIPAQSDDDDLYALAPAAEEPSVKVAAPPVLLSAPSTITAPPSSAEALLANVGRAAATVRRQLGPDPDALKADAELLRESPLRDIVIPIILILVGLFLSAWEVQKTAKEPPAGIAAVRQVSMRVGLSVGLMLGGMLVAISMMDVCIIGSFRRSIFKLIAIAVGPGAIYGLMNFYIGRDAGGELAGATAGTFASVIAYALLFKTLMKFDWKDTSVCTIMTWIMISASNYLAYKVAGAQQDSWI